MKNLTKIMSNKTKNYPKATIMYSDKWPTNTKKIDSI